MPCYWQLRPDVKETELDRPVPRSMVSGEATSDSALSGSEGEDVLSGIASGLDTSDLSGSNGTSGTGTASGTGSKGNSAGNSGNPTTDTSSSGGGSNVSPSGDTTYKVNVSGLTKKTVYIVERAVITNPPKGIMEHDIARLICSLQGLINRDMTKNQIALYIQYDDTDTFWYNQMAASGGVLNGYSKVTISSFTKFLDTFKTRASKLRYDTLGSECSCYGERSSNDLRFGRIFAG